MVLSRWRRNLRLLSTSPELGLRWCGRKHSHPLEGHHFFTSISSQYGEQSPKHVTEYEHKRPLKKLLH